MFATWPLVHYLPHLLLVYTAAVTYVCHMTISSLFTSSAVGLHSSSHVCLPHDHQFFIYLICCWFTQQQSRMFAAWPLVLYLPHLLLVYTAAVTYVCPMTISSLFTSSAVGLHSSKVTYVCRMTISSLFTSSAVTTNYFILFL